MAIAEILNQPPLSGTFEEHHFNGAGCGQWHFVMFTTSEGKQWVGHFRAHENWNLQIAALNAKRLAFIISSGNGYILDIDKKIIVKELKEVCFDVVADEITNSFFVASFDHIIRVDEQLNLNEMNIPTTNGIDDIVFQNLLARKLFFRFHEIAINKECNDYYIDLEKMMIVLKV